MTIPRSAYHSVTLLFAVLMMGGCAATPEVDCSRPGATVLIVGENASRGSVPTESSMYQRVSAALAANLTGQGYRVLQADPLRAAYPEYFGRTSLRHNDSDLLDLVRSSKASKQAQFVVVATLCATVVEADFHKNVTSSLELRVLDVATGKRLSKFAIDSSTPTATRPGCSGSCIDQAIVSNAKPLTLETATVIAEQLGCRNRHSSPFENDSWAFENDSGGVVTAYTLVFDGFSVNEVRRIEAYLEQFAGYDAHRSIYAGARRTEYWYETSMGSAGLNRNLIKLLDRMDLRGVVQFSGNTYSVKKITLRGANTENSRGGKPPTTLSDEGW